MCANDTTGDALSRNASPAQTLTGQAFADQRLVPGDGMTLFSGTFLTRGRMMSNIREKASPSVIRHPKVVIHSRIPLKKRSLKRCSSQVASCEASQRASQATISASTSGDAIDDALVTLGDASEER